MTPEERNELVALGIKQDTQTEILNEIRDDVKQHGIAVSALTSQVEALTKANLPERLAKAETKIKLGMTVGIPGLVAAVGVFVKGLLPRFFGM